MSRRPLILAAAAALVISGAAFAAPAANGQNIGTEPETATVADPDALARLRDVRSAERRPTTHHTAGGAGNRQHAGRCQSDAERHRAVHVPVADRGGLVRHVP